MSDTHEEITAAATAIEEMDLPGGITFNEGTNYRIALVALAAAAQVRNMQHGPVVEVEELGDATYIHVTGDGISQIRLRRRFRKRLVRLYVNASMPAAPSPVSRAGDTERKEG